MGGSDIYTADISDLFALFCSFLPQNNEASDGNYVEVKRRELKPANINLRKESVSNFEWHEIKSLGSANEIYSCCKETWKTVNSLLGRNKKDIILNKFLIENVWIDDPL